MTELEAVKTLISQAKPENKLEKDQSFEASRILIDLVMKGLEDGN